MRPWQEVIPEQDRSIYSKGGFGKRQTLGQKTALLIVDVVESFTGSKSENVIDSINEYRTSCGEDAWTALPHIKALLDHCRDKGVPVVYTKGHPISKAFCGSSTKGSTFKETLQLHSTKIAAIIQPRENEFVLEKTKASAFFGSPLSTYFRTIGVDTLMIVGTTTSGCVRASVVDAFSCGFSVFVVEECCFDRSRFSHSVNLFEMDQKYADVIQLNTALEMINSTYA
jgi:maleamate amidohydrolase